MRIASVLAAASIILVWCCAHLYRDVLQAQQPCEMTYMYAKYMEVDIPTQGTQAPPSRARWRGIMSNVSRVGVAAQALGENRYRLWQYTGDESGRRRGNGLVLPVLFIPGNGGSHEMARSLASETTRRFSRLGMHILEPVEVVWYMLDLEGEWSAFDGRILEAQVQFTLHAMRHLVAVHNITTLNTMISQVLLQSINRDTDAGQQQQQRPLQQHPGLVMVGHSMGGVVAADALARAATDPALGPSIASLLVTLGAPHVRPPAPGDTSLHAFYARAAKRPRPVVPILAIAGGIADIQVATELTNPEGLTPQGLWRWLALPDMPGGWCPSRHNGLVWCNQLVVALGQALVDMAQDALTGLDAARKAAAVAKTVRKRTKVPSTPVLPDSEPIPQTPSTDMDEPMAQSHPKTVKDRGVEQPTAVDRSWDWAIRRVDQHLAHPAQQYLAEALAAGERHSILGGSKATGGLVRAAERALAPVSAGGGACSGANLAWYLQYGQPQLVKPDKSGRAMLYLRPPEGAERASASGVGWKMYTWNLNHLLDKHARRMSEMGESSPPAWAAVISGTTPCSAVRVWLSAKVDYPASSSASGGAAVGDDDGGRRSSRSSNIEESPLEKLEAEARRAMSAQAARSLRHDVEVTSLTVPLPALGANGSWPTRQRGDWYDISLGRNYQSRAGWVLLLPQSSVRPLLEQNGGAQESWQ